MMELYASPDGTGNGATPRTPAAFNAESFWDAVDRELAEVPVTVHLLPDTYVTSMNIRKRGNRIHKLTIDGGENRSDDRATFTTKGKVEIRDSLNIHVTRLDFTRCSIDYGISVRPNDPQGDVETSDITVSRCNWYEIPDPDANVFACFGVRYRQAHHVTIRDCSFRRIGARAGTHMMYHAYGSHHIRIVNCTFIDCSGTFVRLRAGTDFCLIDGCYFGNETMDPRTPIHVAAVNNVDPGDETFGTLFVITNNEFDMSSIPRSGAVLFNHAGHSSIGGPYLLSRAEGDILRGNDLVAKSNLLRTRCAIDPSKVYLYANSPADWETHVNYLSDPSHWATWDDGPQSGPIYDVCNAAPKRAINTSLIAIAASDAN